ncbi:thyrotropin-releasing hormone-degrading ectoenzyme-like isoform X3 [Cataglyphis hispanica]|uniref:thyrotropin-releasing hormone-degrading ectoenzyme-like isoform X2 n=1 Tax=Cataglyphis hispanica TaxID=1086592 RepID=UPI002180012B|nr:thyrotropin-releasing hormone-degrading ectoenzyme-like isoform X2 [Cataglyphis hispanica]XP_050459313.1 thyrotropin-releasing hormone-degrading ectoenzyme-like isoform X3 [Cataglyphis hispanica]
MTIFLKLLLFSYCLTFINAKVFFTDTQIELCEKNLRDFHKIIPEHYNIQLEPDMERNTFYGECNISITILVPTQYLTLYSKIKCLNDVTLTDNPPRFSWNNTEIIDYPINYLYKNTNETVQIFFRNYLSSGRYILNMKYDDIINPDTKLTTFYKQEYKWWVMPTHSDIFAARQVFPCLSELLEATFKITIKHYRKCVAISNMAVQKVEDDDEGMTFTHFRTTPSLPTYLIGGIVTNFYNKPTNKIANVWYRNSSALGIAFAEEVIHHAALHLEKKWKRIDLISKVNHFAIPNFPDNGMVHLWGAVLYREEDIFYNKKLKPVGHKIEIAHLIAYKMSQEWFYKVYNLISASTLFWFNECLIRFLGIDAVDKGLPHIHLMNLFMVQSFHEVLDFDTSYNTPSFNSSYEFPRCIKVSIMLRLLQIALSEQIFWRFMRSYIINNKLNYNNLMGSLNEVMNHKDVSMSRKYKTEIFDIVQIIDPWTKQKHYPTISVNRDYDLSGKMEILIENYNSSYHYCIPLTYTIQSDLSFNDSVRLYWLNRKRSFHLSNWNLRIEDWVIFNLQQLGYYRVNYDLGNWKRIARYLDSENYTNIHVLNRAQIIDDAFHFTITKQLDPLVFGMITAYLKRETDFVAWYPMFKALEYMSSIFLLPEEKSDRLKQRMRLILNKLFEELKSEEIFNDNSDDNDFKKRLIHEVAKWACFLDDYKCQEMANRVLKRHLEHPEKYKLLPWWKKWTYCNGLKLMSHSNIINYENSTWWSKHYMKKENFKIKVLEYLACFEHPAFIRSFLNFLRTNNKTSIILLKDFSDHYDNAFLLNIANYARNKILKIKYKDQMLNFIFNKFMELRPQKHKIAVMFTVLLNHLYSMEQIKEVKEFLNDHLLESKNYIKKNIRKNLKEPSDGILEYCVTVS